MIEQMLSRYSIDRDDDYHNALREILQEIALAGLYRGGFFDKAAFYGGTCLRIFYGLERFSEDLDFSLLEVDEAFKLEPYFQSITEEFESLGIAIEISQKQKSKISSIESAFLKSDTTIHTLELKVAQNNKKKIKIKFEVDKHPPLGFQTQERLLLQPFSFYVNCFAVEDLYAGKMHALLFRAWKTRVKGRDWYDWEWYIKNRFELNLTHLTIRARESGDIREDEVMTQELLRAKLTQKIATLDIESVKTDIRRFIRDDSVLDIWSREYFAQLSQMMVIKQKEISEKEK